MDKIATIKSLTLPDYGTLFFIVFLLPLTKILLVLKGYNGTRCWLERTLPVSVAHLSDDGLQKALRIAYFVNGISKFWPIKINCLHKSLTVWYLMRRAGLTPDICFGLLNKSIVGSNLHAHAWVEYQGVNLLDPPHQQEQYLAFQ